MDAIRGDAWRDGLAREEVMKVRAKYADMALNPDVPAEERTEALRILVHEHKDRLLEDLGRIAAHTMPPRTDEGEIADGRLSYDSYIKAYTDGDMDDVETYIRGARSCLDRLQEAITMERAERISRRAVAMKALLDSRQTWTNA